MWANWATRPPAEYHSLVAHSRPLTAGCGAAGAGHEGRGLADKQGRRRGGQGGQAGRRGRARKVQVPHLRATGAGHEDHAGAAPGGLRACCARVASLVVGALFYQPLLFYQHLIVSAGSAAVQGHTVVRHAVMSHAFTRRRPDRERGACCADTPRGAPQQGALPGVQHPQPARGARRHDPGPGRAWQHKEKVSWGARLRPAHTQRATRIFACPPHAQLLMFWLKVFPPDRTAQHV